MLDRVKTQDKINTEMLSSQDRKLIQRAKTDPSSFAELYRKFAVRVYRYIFARVGNHADAEDLTTQVFMAVMQGLANFDNSGSFTAWLFTIARNKLVDAHRQNKDWVPLDDLEEFLAGNDDLFKDVLQTEEIRLLAGVLKGLTPEQKEMLRLRFAAELTYAQIGDVLNKSEGAVKMALTRLLRQLQNEMEQYNG